MDMNKKQLENEERKALAQSILKKFPVSNKIPLFFLLAAIIFVIIVLNIPPSQIKPKADTSGIEKRRMDSLTIKIKANKDFDIRDVYYNPQDSSFKIAFTNKDNMIKEGTYSTDYFNNEYHLDSLPEVEGVYLYSYKRGKHLKNGDYNNALVYTSKHLAEYQKRFDEKFLTHRYGYQPLYLYLNESLNDPSSLEIVRSGNLGMNEDSTFSTKTIFRSKNAFGALMLHAITCDISFDGSLSKISLDK